MKQEAPPLRVWGYTGAALGIVLLILGNEERLPGLRHMSGSRAVHYMNLERLDEAPAGRLEIVALGSSKVFYALDSDDTFEQRLAGEPSPVVFRRLTWLGANSADMEPVLERLSQHPPNWLLLESDLLLFDHSARFPIRDHLRPLEARLNSLLTQASSEAELQTNRSLNEGQDRFPSPQECLANQSPDMRLVYALHVATWKTSSREQRERYLRWLRLMRERGTRIVLLDIPRAPWAQAVFPARLRADNQAVLQGLVREEGFALWQSGPLSEGAFCDEAHMSAMGRAQFSDWLAHRLAGSLHAPLMGIAQHVR